MAATFYYVMTDGVNNGTDTTGGYSSRQTTSFATLGAANYYPSIAAVLSGNTMTDDDEIICANTHDIDYNTALTTLTFTHNITIYSVLYTDLTTYTAGAIEKVALNGGDLRLTASIDKIVKSYGVSFKADDDLHFNNTNAQSNIEINDCAAGITGSGSAEVFYLTGQDGCGFTGNEVDFSFAGATQGVIVQAGGKTVINGGSLTYTSNPSAGFLKPGGAGGSTIEVNSFDASTVTGGDFIQNLATADDHTEITLNRVLMGTGFSIYSGTINNPAQKIDAYGVNVGDGFHYYEHHRRGGNSEEELAIYRTSGDTYDGSTNFSTQLITNSLVNEYVDPLRVPLKSYQLDLSAGATLTWYICLDDDGDTAIPAALNNHDCWIEIQRPDATNNALGVVQSSRAANILSTKTDLTTSTEAWTGDNVTNKRLHEIAITIPTLTGMTNAVVTAEICLAKDITTAGDSFFIDTKPDVS